MHEDGYLSKQRDETIVHEIQHAIQKLEGFERGGNREKGLEALRNAAINALKKQHDSRYQKEYQEYLATKLFDWQNGTDKATE